MDVGWVGGEGGIVDGLGKGGGEKGWLLGGREGKWFVFVYFGVEGERDLVRGGRGYGDGGEGEVLFLRVWRYSVVGFGVVLDILGILWWLVYVRCWLYVRC